jgi:iron complex outermembrane recepter protein
MQSIDHSSTTIPGEIAAMSRQPKHRLPFMVALIAITRAADAQESAPAAAPALDEIVVTAQKREQSLQDVPMAVSALTSSMLRDAGVVSIQGVVALVPSLEVVTNDSPIDTAYRIRGVGSDADIPTFEPDVGLFVDGVYMVRSGLGIDELADIERIEVLKGPQSTLYGKNVTAGVVNVVTKAPSKSFEASLDSTVSSLDGSKDAFTYRISGSMSGPLSDRVRGRVTAVWYQQGTTVENLDPGGGNANSMKRYAARGLLDVDVAQDTLLRLSFARAEMPKSYATNPGLYYGPTSIAIGEQLGPLFGLGPCPVNDPNARIICASAPYQTTAHNDLAAATLTAPIGSNTLTSITAWTDYVSDNLEPDVSQVQAPIVSTYDNQQKGTSFSQELRLASANDKTLEWLGGLYYLHTSLEWGNLGRTPTFVLGPAAPYVPLDPSLPPDIVVGQNGDVGYQNSQAYSDYAAVFGQATWHLSERFSLTGGLRRQDERKHDSVDATSDVAPNPNPAYAGTPYEYLNLVTAVLSSPAGNGTYRHDSDNWTYSATANYQPTDGGSIYATYSHGSKAGGTNIGYGSATPAQRPFADETVNNIEAGAKFSLDDQRVRLAFAAFHTVYDQFQNAGFAGLQFLVNNAAKVTVNGLEADGTIAPVRGLTLNMGVTYLRAKYDTYLGGACYFGRAPDSLPDAGGAFTACNLSGNTLPFAPDWRSTLGIQYEHATRLGALYGRADWQWSSDYHTNTNLDPRNIQDAYSLVNLRLGLRLDDGLDVSLFSNNLFNRTVIAQDAVANLIADGSYQRYLANPREIGLTVRQKF